MVSRYFMLSGIPLSQLTVINEIQNMVSHLIENLSPGKSKRRRKEGMKNSFFIFGNVSFPDWDIFEFITKKEGRRGPSKQECIAYYYDKYVFN